MKQILLILLACITVGFQLHSSESRTIYDQATLQVISAHMPNASVASGPGEQTGNRRPLIYTCYDENTSLPVGHGGSCVYGSHPTCVANACTDIKK